MHKLTQTTKIIYKPPRFWVFVLLGVIVSQIVAFIFVFLPIFVFADRSTGPVVPQGALDQSAKAFWSIWFIFLIFGILGGCAVGTVVDRVINKSAYRLFNAKMRRRKVAKGRYKREKSQRADINEKRAQGK